MHPQLKQYMRFLFKATRARFGHLHEKKSKLYLKGKLSDSFTNYNYVGNTKVSVSIKKT